MGYVPAMYAKTIYSVVILFPTNCSISVNLAELSASLLASDAIRLGASCLNAALSLSHAWAEPLLLGAPDIC